MSVTVRVLLVDDEPTFTALVVDCLEDEDSRFDVIAESRVDTALDRLEKEYIDCVVADYEMPDESGLAFLQEVRRRWGELPFILFTGKGSEEVAAEAIAAGATDYLQKDSGTGQFTVLANRIMNAVDRHRSQLASERALDRLRETLAHITDGYVAFDRELTIVDINEQTAQFVGDDRENLIGRSYYDIMADNGATEPLNAYKAVLETGEPQTIESRSGVHPDRWVEDRIFPADDGIYVYSRDITERKAREHDLERFRDLLQQAERLASLGGWEFTADGGAAWSSGARRIVGIDDEVEPSIDRFLKFFHPEDRATIEQAIDASLAGKEFDRYGRIRRTDDVERWVRIKGRPDPDRNAVRGFMQDVTEMHDREEMIRRIHDVATDLAACDTREEVYDRTIQAAGSLLDFDQAVIAIEDDGLLTIEVMSEDVPLEERTSLSVDEGVAGRTYRTGESILVSDAADDPDAKPQTDIGGAMSVPIGSYGVFQVIDQSTAAFDEGDLELAELLISHTESALRLLDRERVLADQNARLNEFTAVVTHDLRNPLNIAQGRLALAEEECESDHLTEVARAHTRMDTLIDDLLDLALAGAQIGEQESVDLAALTRECWASVDTAEATLQTETTATIFADRSRLRQLLENLFRNSVEHGGADITVSVGDLDDGFVVEDDGPGIPADIASSIFDTGVSSTRDGTGYGLSIVRGIAEAHGWSIEATDGSTGGARFAITGVTFAE